jgi:hypothetical protein
MKQFTLLAMFDNLDQAMEAERVLRAEGYSTWILADIDDYSRTVWMDVWCPCDAENYKDPRFDLAWKKLDAIVSRLGGFDDEAGLVDEGELPREAAFEYEVDPVTRKYLFPQIARYPHH